MINPLTHHEALLPVSAWLRANWITPPVKLLRQRFPGPTSQICRAGLESAFEVLSSADATHLATALERFDPASHPFALPGRGRSARPTLNQAAHRYLSARRELVEEVLGYLPAEEVRRLGLEDEFPPAEVDRLVALPGELILPHLLGLWAFGLELRATREEEAARARNHEGRR